jgi:hypothetical protein
VCSTWTITTQNLTTGGSSVGVLTNNTIPFGTGPGQVVAGAFELNFVDTCSKLPYPGLSFGNVQVRGMNGNILSPATMNWVDGQLSGFEPECWFKATHVNDSQNLLTTANLNWSLCGAAPLSAIESLLLR